MELLDKHKECNEYINPNLLWGCIDGLLQTGKPCPDEAQYWADKMWSWMR